MTDLTILGTSRLGAEPNCAACGAGQLISFNWSYAQEHGTMADRKRVSQLSLWKTLRRGSLYRCGMCGEVWHLDGVAQTMTHVGRDRLDFVLSWNRQPIEMPENLRVIVEQIGPTPPDMYGNGRERRVTPCTVETKSGDVFETAMICIQPEAPIQDWMQFRLGGDIAQIRESPFALPLAVREASSRSEEMRMGFSPTLIAMPDGCRFVMNGMTSFMAVPSYDPRDAQVTSGSYFTEAPSPAFVDTPENLVYFIFDGDPGWACCTAND